MKAILASAVVVLYLLPLTMSRGQGTIYLWSSFDGYPGGLSGTIVLNSPSYSGPFDASRILSITLSDSTSGTYNAQLPNDIYGWGPAVMSWGPSGISELVLGLTPDGLSSWFIIADENNLYGFAPASLRGPGTAYDGAGAWVAANVPEPGLTPLLMLMGACVIQLCRARSRAKLLSLRALD